MIMNADQKSLKNTISNTKNNKKVRQPKIKTSFFIYAIVSDTIMAGPAKKLLKLTS